MGIYTLRGRAAGRTAAAWGLLDLFGATGIAAYTTSYAASRNHLISLWAGAQTRAILNYTPGHYPAGNPTAPPPNDIPRLDTARWLILPAAQGGLSTFWIVGAGDDTVELSCWERILNSGELDAKKIADYHKNGVVLTELYKYCTIFKSKDDGKLIVRNKKGEYFAFTVTEDIPASERIDGKAGDYNVTLVHAVPIQVRE